MQHPKVSVIIPMYNASKFLNETLESILNQSYNNIEIIIIDDNSTDGSFNQALKFQSNSIWVKKNKKKGACAARNYGFDLSTGDYIQYLDADDILSPSKIEDQVNALQNQKNSIAVCNTKHFYNTINEGKITDQGYLFTTSDVKSFLLNIYGSNGLPNMVAVSAWLTPKELIRIAGPWDESLMKDQDGEFFCRVVTKADQVIYVPNALNFYRKHRLGQNIANQKQRIHIESQLKALDSKYEQLKSLKDTDAFKAAFSIQYKWLAVDAYPEFKDISKKAFKTSEVLGGSNYLPVLGGKIIETTNLIFGWKAAKSLSYWVHRIKP